MLKPKGAIFQNLCYYLLEKESDVMSIVSIGKATASDRGRDFELIEREFRFGGPVMIKWLVQCKYSNKST